MTSKWFRMLSLGLVLCTWLLRIPASPLPSSAITVADQQEIINLAAQILKTAMNEESYFSSEKRNAGTIDSLYNLPHHLLTVGRRR